MIPVLYVFSYSEDKTKEALKRLKNSLQSLYNQNCEITILNASNYSLLELEYIYKVHIINIPYAIPFNKSKFINYAIKNHMNKYDYVLLSDIDIIWPENAIERMQMHIDAYPDEPVRVIPYCKDKTNPSKNGFGEGLGLIHVPSFIKIHGYDERFIGYGSEDVELNNRLHQINKTIFVNDIDTIHQSHELSARIQVEKNIDIFEESMKLIKDGDLIRNGNNWGEL